MSVSCWFYYYGFIVQLEIQNANTSRSSFTQHCVSYSEIFVFLYENDGKFFFLNPSGLRLFFQIMVSWDILITYSFPLGIISLIVIGYRYSFKLFYLNLTLVDYICVCLTYLFQVFLSSREQIFKVCPYNSLIALVSVLMSLYSYIILILFPCLLLNFTKGLSIWLIFLKKI